MRSTIRTEGGTVAIQATAGRVFTNGVHLLPHEASLMASELQRAAHYAQAQALTLMAEAARLTTGAGVTADEKSAVLGAA